MRPMGLILMLSLLVSLNVFATNKIVKVEKLIYLMDTENALRTNLKTIAQNLKLHSNIKDEDQFNEAMNQILNLEDLVEFQKKQYMTLFNEEELDDIISFYQSRGGKRLRRVNSEMLSGAMDFAHQMIKKKMHLLKK